MKLPSTIEASLIMLAAVSASSAKGDSFSIADFGAKSDGVVKCTDAFAKAIDAAANSGGGKVVVPPGKWLTGHVELKTDVTLHVEKGATVLFSDDLEDYAEVVTPHEGIERKWLQPLIGAKNAERVGITGEGVFTCRTERWWSKDFWKGDRRKAAKRPHFMTFDRCRDVTLDGFTLRESPCWTIHLFCVDKAVVRNLDVAAHGPNCDGIDIESSSDVLVENCRFDQGDDAICIKSGRNAEGRKLNRPSRDILIRNCTVAHGHTLLGIGSELSGGIRNVRMENCRVEGEVWRFLRVKTNPARGGFVENVVMENVSGGTATEEIFSIETDYFWKQESKRNPEVVYTRIDGIRLKDIVVDAAKRIERRSVKLGPPPENDILENVRVRDGGVKDDPAAAFLEELKTLPREGRYFVSFTHPWNAENDNPESKVCSLAGKVPKMYFSDFRFVAGSWMSKNYHSRCRRRLTDIVRRLYAEYGSVPVFSWHPENPFAPKEWKDPKGRSAPYRYRFGVEGYPEEHRYVIAECLTTGTDAAKWYDARLDEIAEFLNGLKDDSGNPIPCVVRLFHECEDDWSWWGPKSVSTEDYMRIWRKTVAYLRERVNGGRNLLFMFTPDRYWNEVGEPRKKGTFLWRYPGDDIVDIIGFDDYSIGKFDGDESTLQVTIGKLRALTAEAERRGKACGLSETGCKGRRDDFYDLLLCALSAEGCRVGFVNTWAGDNTIPANDAMKDGFMRYVGNGQSVFAGEYKPFDAIRD